jgi:hypothetical protein
MRGGPRFEEESRLACAVARAAAHGAGKVPRLAEARIARVRVQVVHVSGLLRRVSERSLQEALLCPGAKVEGESGGWTSEHVRIDALATRPGYRY